MKVFIYDKKESKPYIILQNVTCVDETKDKIRFTTDVDEIIEIPKKIYKSTCYQN